MLLNFFILEMKMATAYLHLLLNGNEKRKRKMKKVITSKSNIPHTPNNEIKMAQCLKKSYKNISLKKN